MNYTTLLVLAAALSASCSSSKPMTVDNALLGRASAQERQVIATARSERDTAGDDLAIATAERARAEDELDMAKLALKTAKAGTEQSKLAVEIAEASGSPSQLQSTAERHTQTLALEDVAREVVAVEKRELELAQFEEKAAGALHVLREAQVEEAKAVAVQDVDLVEIRNVPLTEFRKTVATRQREVEKADERVEEAKKRLKEANEAHRKASAHARTVGADGPSLAPLGVPARVPNPEAMKEQEAAEKAVQDAAKASEN